MTNEQYYWNVMRPSMLHGAMAAYAKAQKKKKLRVEGEAIEGAELSHTKFEINGKEYDSSNYGKDLEFAPGSNISLKLIGDSGSQVYKINGEQLEHLMIEVQLEPFALNEDTVVSVVYKPNWM